MGALATMYASLDRAGDVLECQPTRAEPLAVIGGGKARDFYGYSQTSIPDKCDFVIWVQVRFTVHSST